MNGGLEQSAAAAAKKQRDRILFDVEYVAPRGPLEQELAVIIGDLLGYDRLGARDDYFELGGDSVIAMQIVTRIRLQLGIEAGARAIFEAPTVESLAARLGALVVPAAQERPGIPRAARDQPLAASFAQEDHWLFEQFEGPDPIVANLRVRGGLDLVALRAGLDDVMARHEILRTTFVEDGEALYQTIDEASRAEIAVVDLAHLNDASRDSGLHQAMLAHAQQTLDLRRGPLLRMQAIRLASDDHVLALCAHHAVFDGWSMSLFLRELVSRYEARVRGDSATLPPLPVQFADFASWQRAHFADERLDGELSYWKEKLANASYAEIPVDRPRLPKRSVRGASFDVEIDAALLAGAHELAAAESTTLYVVLLATLNALLARVARVDDVVVGTTIATRPFVETESLIGPFINGLALRTDTGGRPSARELVRRTRDVSLEAYEHRDLPFNRIVRELRLPRDRSRTPLYQVMFILLNMPGARSSDDAGGLAFEWVALDRGLAPFDLSISALETPSGLRLRLEYATALYDAATIERFAAQYVRLLEAVVSDPDARCEELPLLSSAEQERVVVTFNQTRVSYGPHEPIHRLIEQQVDRSPDATALVFEESRCTYAELDARANRIAHGLRRRGVGPDVLVGVCLERSLELVIAVLAVLKAGGAYVALEPNYPAERLRFMIDDASPAIVLASDATKVCLPEAHHARIIDIAAPTWDAEPSTRLDVPTSPTNLAYVIFTSGSTGRPKGALNTHEGIANRLLWMQQAFPLDASDAVLQKTPFGFDVSVWELFWPLMFGARLVIAPPESHRDPSQLVDLIRSESVTTMHFVPSMLQLFLEHPDVPLCTSVRRVICSGEALSFELKERFLERSAAELHNLYGPTEAAVDVSWWRAVRGGQSVPIGRPIANTELYILDPRGNPLPIGVPGELHIGGVQLSRGYVNQAALTAEKFVPNPFGAPGSRLYRTGDLARFRADGEIEYLGRIDSQVKLRGVRIELGEIEAALSQLDGVRDAAAALRSGGCNDPILAGFVAVEDAASFDVEAARAALRRVLPHSMVPGALVLLPALPQTPNGKVDRRALALPDVTASRPAYVAPRSELETKIARAWSEVLRVERVGISDDFFALGGHSLLVARVVARLHDSGVPATIAQFFMTPTVAGMAKGIEERGAVRPLVSVDRSGPLPLSWSQQMIWGYEQQYPGTTAWGIPVGLVFRRVDVGVLEHAFRLVIERHEMLRTRFELVDGEPKMLVRPAEETPIEIVDGRDWPGDPMDRARALFDELATRPFNVLTDWLSNILLVRIRDDEVACLLNMHHLVADGVGFQVLIANLRSIYGRTARREPLSLVPPPIQYGDYAVWDRELNQPEHIAPALAYWSRRLAGAEPLRLPLDSVDGSSRRAIQVATPFSERLASAIDDLARRLRVTPYAITLGVFNAFLGDLCGTDDVVTFTTAAVNRRKHNDLVPLVGFFMNPMPIRVNASGDPTFEELVQRSATAVRDALAHEAPGVLVFDTPSPSDSPLGRAMLNFMEGGADPPAEPEASPFDVKWLPPIDAGRDRKSPLAWVVMRRGSGLAGTLVGGADWFTRETIERWAKQVIAVAERAVREPTLRLTALRAR